MELKTILNILAVVFAVGMTTGTAFAAANADPSKHFHPKGKMPSEHTKQIFAAARKNLPFSDKQDFEEQAKGFIAAPDYMKIMADI